MKNFIKIYPPIEIIQSKFYGLIIKDKTGKEHYFNFDGSYDGYSIDCQRCFATNNTELD